MAVSPLLSTALMSSPRSSATCTASSTSLSVPASSPGERVPRPAAAISGVLLSAFGSSGIGAERGQRPHQLGVGGQRGQQERRRADRRSGACCPRFTFLVIRAFTFAPVRHQLLRRARGWSCCPTRPAAGSLSPTPGLRTHGDRVERGVAGRSAFGSAPASSSSAASSKCAFVTARSSGAGARAAAAGRRSRAGVPSTGIVSLTSAPAFSSDADDVDAAFADGEEQRREAGRQARA